MTELTDPALRRRRRQEHSDPRSRAFLRELRLPDDGRCLEIGAGYGSIAQWLAVTVVPQGEVIATEARRHLVDSINADADANLRAVHHDVASESLPEGPYDLIYARFVLEHLPSRDDLLADFSKALRQGGWLVIEDAVFDGAALDGPGSYRAAMLAFAAGQPATSYGWAARLPQAMADLELQEIRAQRISDLFRAGSELAAFWASALVQGHSGSETTESAPADTAVAELTEGNAWFAGPIVVQCAARRAPEASQ